jgi:preprotein translocase subunit SecE
MSKTTEYFKETKAELKHVNWPGRRQTIYYTLIVVALSIIVAYFLGIFDFIFSRGLEKIIGY